MNNSIDEPTYDAGPPTLEDVLADIDLFLEAIDRRYAGDCVRHIVLNSGSGVGRGNVQGISQFCPGFRLVPTLHWRKIAQHPYLDVHVLPPPPHSNVYKSRSAAAVARLVETLLLAGVNIDDEGPGYSNGTPLMCLAGSMRDIDVRMKSPKYLDPYYPDSCAVRPCSLAMQEGYMFLVFKALLNVGADVKFLPGLGRPYTMLGHLICAPFRAGQDLLFSFLE